MEEIHHDDVKQGSNKQPPSRGIPSKESLWLEDIRKLRDEWKYHQNVRLELEQIMHLIFPEKYQAKYYEVGLKFMQKLLEKLEMRGADIGQFISENHYSKATFYNVILPRLKRVGMVSMEREEFTHERSKQKFYKKIIRPSKQFSILWKRVSEEYDSIVDTAKARKGSQQPDNAGNNPENK